MIFIQCHWVRTHSRMRRRWIDNRHAALFEVARRVNALACRLIPVPIKQVSQIRVMRPQILQRDGRSKHTSERARQSS